LGVIAELRRAQELDPLSLNIQAVLGRQGYYFARQYDRAIVQLRQTLEMDRGFWIGHNFLGWVYLCTGQLAQAVAAFQRAKSLDDNPETCVGLGYAYAVSGDKEEARKELAGLAELAGRRYVAPVNLALIHIGLGEYDEAFAWLEKAGDHRSQWLSEILVDPAFDPLRPDPRFTDLLRRVGFTARS
jgi:Flp pilus assembly protein TadD